MKRLFFILLAFLSLAFMACDNVEGVYYYEYQVYHVQSAHGDLTYFERSDTFLAWDDNIAYMAALASFNDNDQQYSTPNTCMLMFNLYNGSDELVKTYYHPTPKCK